MVLLILAVNFIGFAHTYYLAGLLHAPLPSAIVHVHGALFTCWLLLLLTQTVLVSMGRVRWHRRLGVLGGVIAALMLIAGPLVLVGALRRHAFSQNEGYVIFAADLCSLTLFAFFVASGLLRRNDSAVHKRLMLFASIAILAPGLSRWSFAFMVSPYAFYGIYLAFPIAILLFDLVTLRKVLRVTLLGSVLVTIYIFGVGPLSHTALLHRITDAIQQQPSSSRKP